MLMVWNWSLLSIPVIILVRAEHLMHHGQSSRILQLGLFWGHRPDLIYLCIYGLGILVTSFCNLCGFLVRRQLPINLDGSTHSDASSKGEDDPQHSSDSTKKRRLEEGEEVSSCYTYM